MSPKNKKKSSHKKSHTQKATPEDKHLKALEDIFETREIEDENNDNNETTNKKKKDQNSDDNNVIAKIIEQERQKRRNQILWGISIILSFCAIAAVAGFFYFNTYNPFAEEKIELSIDGPQKAIAGEEVKYEIKYANDGEIDIKNAKLIINEPTGFYLKESTPEMIGHSFDLGEIKAGNEGQVTILGSLIDAINSTQTLTANLIFVPNNFNSEFSSTKEFYTALEPTNFDIKINAPQNVIPGEIFTVEITNTYNGLFPLENYKIAILPPNNFTITESTPKHETNSSEWIITNNQPGDGQVFTFSGYFDENITFENEENRQQTFHTQLLIPNNDNQYFIQHDIENKLKVVDQAVKTNLIINGSSESQNVNLGDKLNITATFNNNGSETFQDLTLSVNLKTLPIDIIDWENINDPNFGRLEKTEHGKTITWSSDQIENFKELKPEEKGSINFSIPIKSLADLEDENISDVSKVTIEGFTAINLLNEDNQILPTINGNQISLGLNSNVDLSIKALYYFPDGTPIGTGPLPPKVNESTKYVVILELDNQLHEIKDININTTLGDKVSWPGIYEQTVGEIKYNKSEKKLSWEINRLPTTADNPSFTFQINLTPQQSDAGKLMKLLSNLNLTATDSVTGNQISLTYGIVSSNLENDNFAIGKGIVQE